MFLRPMRISLLLLLFSLALPYIALGSELSALLTEADPQRCRDTFDPGLKKQCMRGEWEQKYYFDADSRECRLFWYDGCPGLTGSRNFFDSLLECQWLCEPGQTQSAICVEPFDEHLRDECDGAGNWRRHFYFDRIRRRCVPFWYDGCESNGANHFQDEHSCTRTCEETSSDGAATAVVQKPESSGSRTQYIPAWRMISTTPKTPGAPRQAVAPAIMRSTPSGKPRYDQRQTSPQHPSRYRDSAASSAYSESPTSASFSASSSVPMITFPDPTPTPLATDSSPDGADGAMTIAAAERMAAGMNCDQSIRCHNGGTCVFDVVLKQPMCKCAPGYTNDYCTEQIDFDPCSPNPCKNGASCSATAGQERTSYDCFCARNFAARHCELKPCEDNPCKNGGTCRTTRSPSLFFCECPPNWGGKTCMIAVPSSEEIAQDQAQLMPGNVNFTQHLSSGRAEWIEELKRVTPMMPTSSRSAEELNFTASRNDHSALRRPANIVGLRSSEEVFLDDEDVDDLGPGGSSPLSSIYSHHRASTGRRSNEKHPGSGSGGLSAERIIGPQEMPTRTLKGPVEGSEKRNGGEGPSRWGMIGGMIGGIGIGTLIGTGWANQKWWFLHL